jgi:iron complex outermembrane receptor protein
MVTAGLSYRFTKNKTIYASISKGFSTPTVSETLTPDGEINTSLKPEIGWNYELGLKLHGLNNKLYTELTFFSTQITNLLVARRTAEDQYTSE